MSPKSPRRGHENQADTDPAGAALLATLPFPSPASPRLGAAAALSTPPGEPARLRAAMGGREAPLANQGQMRCAKHLAKEQQDKTKSSMRNEGRAGQGGSASRRAALLRRNRFADKGDGTQGLAAMRVMGTAAGAGVSCAQGLDTGGFLGAFKSRLCPRGPAAGLGLALAQGSSAPHPRAAPSRLLPALGGHHVRRFPAGLQIQNSPLS